MTRALRSGRAKGQKSQRRPISDYQAPAQGCENCRFWIEAPREWDAAKNEWKPPDGFKRCQRLIVITKRGKVPGQEVGMVLAIEDAANLEEHAEWMLLPTARQFTCSRWEQGTVAEEQEAPDDLPQQPALFEESPTYAA
jgi:hypothetical protein